MRFLSAIFVKGLAAILPLTVTIYFFYWLGSTAGTLMQTPFESIFGESIPYRPIYGVGLAVAFIFIVGLLMNAYLIRVLFELGEKLLQRIPLVKTLYGSIRDLMGFFSSSDDKQKMSQVVMLQVGDTPLRLLGLVTREDFGDLPGGIAAEGTVAVYLPMSYQLGGFTTIVPRSCIEQIDMSVEDAMRFAVTAGMTAGEEGKR